MIFMRLPEECSRPSEGMLILLREDFSPSLFAIYLSYWVPTAGYFWVCVIFSSACLKCHITSVLRLLPPQTHVKMKALSE